MIRRKGPTSMPVQTISTDFAPAERSTPADLNRQVGYFSNTSLTHHLLDAVPSLLLILNSQRQIVYANKALLDLVANGEEDLVHGMRPGEVLNCIHSSNATGGCGTTEACSTCGAVLAILAGLKGERAMRECRITRCAEGQQESLDLQVLTTPLVFEGEAFTVFAINDISHEKRRQALEKIFFHDVLNLLGSIKGFAELLHTYNPTDREEIFSLIQSAAEQTIEEIEAQRILTAAENKELRLKPEAISVHDYLRQLVGIYERHEAAEGRSLCLAPDLPKIVVTTDRTLLGRILGNMIKNALEACPLGETVTLGCNGRKGRIEFTVHNPGFIPREAALQIFQRSFSTKGHGRGLGTYSMRLLSEYLQGEVDFSSTPEDGTIFRATYPQTLAMN